MNTYYFLKELGLDEHPSDIRGFSHSYIPKDYLQQNDTILIDLSKSKEELLKQLHQKNRKQIKKALDRGFHIEILNRPSTKDIRAFQKFYNDFAQNSNTYPCNSFHINTMSKLRNKNALIITKLMNNSFEVLCYQVYISDGETAFSLYSASHFRFKKTSEERRLLSEASRYLQWHNILYFKETHHTIYDMGGLTRNENIRKFKMEFGGKITEVYSGYEANSIVGKLILWLRSIKIKEG